MGTSTPWGFTLVVSFIHSTNIYWESPGIIAQWTNSHGAFPPYNLVERQTVYLRIVKNLYKNHLKNHTTQYLIINCGKCDEGKMQASINNYIGRTTLNILKTTESNTLKEWTLWYVNYIWIKLLFKRALQWLGAQCWIPTLLAHSVALTRTSCVVSANFFNILYLGLFINKMKIIIRSRELVFPKP